MDAASYRMVVSTEADYVFTTATAHRLVDDWLTSAPKRYDVSGVDEGRNEIRSGVTLDRDADLTPHVHYTRWRLRERAPHHRGVWQTTLVVSSSVTNHERTWVQLDVEHRPDSPEAAARRAETPRLADALLAALDTRDGLADIRPRASHIAPDDVAEVIEEICDGQRRLPVVVASVPHQASTEAWTHDIVDKAFSQLTGRSVLYVLTREAQAAFNRALEYHPLYGGGIRTYLPGVDPAWPADGLRHPVMSRTTVETDPRSAARILSALPRREAARTPLPDVLAHVPVQRLRPRHVEHDSELARLKAGNTLLDQLLTEAADTEAANRNQIRILENELADAEWLAQESYAELAAAQNQVRALQKRLVDAGRYEEAYTPAEASDGTPPGSFTELLDRIHEFPTLRFTGDPKVAKSLDERSKSNWVALCWDALLALEDFAAASAEGKTQTDFRNWCQNLPAECHPFSAGKVTMKESLTVARNPAWRNERMLPVPTTVDPSGRVYMQAHLRVGGGNSVSPRLHFYDDTAKTGLLYIGHVGPHLTTTQST
jgi:uncharacterized RmlC-like cupin family protein